MHKAVVLVNVWISYSLPSTIGFRLVQKLILIMDLDLDLDLDLGVHMICSEPKDTDRLVIRLC